MAETQLNITRADLQSLMAETVAAAVKAAKEPTEAEQARLDKEKAQQLRSMKEMADLAKVQESSKNNRWFGCPHSDVYNGRMFYKWNGQVNSDGWVAPVCNICHVESPHFSASLLPDGGKQGVNFEAWVQPPTRELLGSLHKQSYKSGKCDKPGCFVCDPPKR